MTLVHIYFPGCEISENGVYFAQVCLKRISMYLFVPRHQSIYCQTQNLATEIPLDYPPLAKRRPFLLQSKKTIALFKKKKNGLNVQDIKISQMYRVFQAN